MNEFDKLSAAISNFVTATVEMVDAMADFVKIALTCNTEYDLVIVPAIYEVAKKNNPGWVHRANFSKKKRIRKKYHDRIIREYGTIVNRQAVQI